MLLYFPVFFSVSHVCFRAILQEVGQSLVALVLERVGAAYVPKDALLYAAILYDSCIWFGSSLSLGAQPGQIGHMQWAMSFFTGSRGSCSRQQRD